MNETKTKKKLYKSEKKVSESNGKQCEIEKERMHLKIIISIAARE